jgi:zinc and cadmium transporter
MLLTYIIIFSVLGSVGAIIVAGLFLTFPDKIQNKLIPFMVSYATGTLLGSAFLGLIPEAMERLSPAKVSGTVLGGIILFFILEKLVIWRHCHHDECIDDHHTSGGLILIGDAFHNFVDGVIISVAFITSIPLGIATAFSVISHEIPQEVGDFVILLKNKYSRKKAFGLNIISGLTAVVGALLGYFFIGGMKSIIPYIMALSASSFIYIAIGDLIPELHKHSKIKAGMIQLSLMLLGILTIFLLSHNH